MNFKPVKAHLFLDSGKFSCTNNFDMHLTDKNYKIDIQINKWREYSPIGSKIGFITFNYENSIMQLTSMIYYQIKRVLNKN